MESEELGQIFSKNLIYWLEYRGKTLKKFLYNKLKTAPVRKRPKRS